MTEILLNDIELIFNQILIHISELFVPVLAIYLVFWIIRNLIFKE